MLDAKGAFTQIREPQPESTHKDLMALPRQARKEQRGKYLLLDPGAPETSVPNHFRSSPERQKNGSKPFSKVYFCFAGPSAAYYPQALSPNPLKPSHLIK